MSSYWDSSTTSIAIRGTLQSQEKLSVIAGGKIAMESQMPTSFVRNDKIYGDQSDYC